ncbi:MAG: type II secretion system F family protein, partial [Candidatus Hinthialibacter sp.]
MIVEPIWIGVLSFAAAFFFVLGFAAVLRVIKHPVDSRIERLQRNSNAALPAPSMFRPEFNDQSVVASLGQKLAPKDPAKRSISQKRLTSAGYYNQNAIYYYWVIKMISTTLPPVLVLAFFIIRQIPVESAMIPSMFAFGVGMLAPDMFLHWQKKSRQDQIFKGLPDTLDLLLVCVEAGLGLDASMQKVSEELHLSCRVLSEELQLTCTAIRFGQDRNDALHDLGERTEVMDLKSLTSVLIQADKFGVSIGQSLRVHADDM